MMLTIHINPVARLKMSAAYYMPSLHRQGEVLPLLLPANNNM